MILKFKIVPPPQKKTTSTKKSFLGVQFTRCEFINTSLSFPFEKICAQDFPLISWNSLWNFRHCRGISQDKQIICGNISELIYIYLLRTIKFQKNLVFNRYIIFAILRALYQGYDCQVWFFPYFDTVKY